MYSVSKMPEHHKNVCTLLLVCKIKEKYLLHLWTILISFVNKLVIHKTFERKIIV